MSARRILDDLSKVERTLKTSLATVARLKETLLASLAAKVQRPIAPAAGGREKK